MGGYFILLGMIWVMNGPSKLSVSISIVLLLTILAFAWVGFFSHDTRMIKLNFMMDMRNPNHLISASLKRIESR